MNDLDDSRSYWKPLIKIPGFQDLVFAMRLAAVDFLVNSHGWDRESAYRKASHSLIVWMSVHTEDSTHQPHVTEDALIGGVYYINVPDGSGVLDLYDPRGKHPIRDLEVPTEPATPPFHRIHSVKPQESLLVLFPGWLVHSVRTPSVTAFSVKSKLAQDASTLSFDGKYRVSMSLNLKGEWIDTSNAAFGCPTSIRTD
jgi:uncharacterized protein (TIGR02466 family)